MNTSLKDRLLFVKQNIDLLKSQQNSFHEQIFILMLSDFEKEIDQVTEDIHSLNQEMIIWEQMIDQVKIKK